LAGTSVRESFSPKVIFFGATGRSSAFSLRRGKNHTSYREWHVFDYCGNMPKPQRQHKKPKKLVWLGWDRRHVGVKRTFPLKDVLLGNGGDLNVGKPLAREDTPIPFFPGIP
jgi:hypothetical protein